MNLSIFRILRLFVVTLIGAVVLMSARRLLGNEPVAWLWSLLFLVLAINATDSLEHRCRGGKRADPTEGEQ